MLWVAALLAVVAAVLLAFVPRLPSSDSSQGFGLASSSLRITRNTNRRLRVFAVTQIAASFVLLAGASMLLKTLLALQSAPTGFDTRHVLAINVPVMSFGKTPDQIVGFYQETMRRIKELPGVDAVAVGTADGHVRGPGEDDPRSRLRVISPGFFAALGVPIIGGRDFNDADRRTSEPVVIVSQSVAQRMFPNQGAVNRHVLWTDPVIKFIDLDGAPRRIVGVAAELEDGRLAPGTAMTGH